MRGAETVGKADIGRRSGAEEASAGHAHVVGMPQEKPRAVKAAGKRVKVAGGKKNKNY